MKLAKMRTSKPSLTKTTRKVESLRRLSSSKRKQTTSATPSHLWLSGRMRDLRCLLGIRKLMNIKRSS